MRRLLRIAALLYPPSWRARYGRELEVLLEDAGPSWHQLMDVLQGAIVMHASARSFAAITVVCSLFGLAAATAIAFRIPDQYVSVAVLRAKSPATPDFEIGVQHTAEQILSRRTLTSLIQTYRLYAEARAKKPLEDVIQEMQRDINISPVKKADARDGFAVSFSYSDRDSAQKVTRDLAARFLNSSPPIITLEVFDRANLPDHAIYPNRWTMAAIGLGGGLVIGLLIAAIRRRAVAYPSND